MFIYLFRKISSHPLQIPNSFNPTGNITSKSDVGTFTYPAPGSARPHGVTAIAGAVNNGTGIGGSVVNPTYAYDANGNLTSGGGRSLTYTAFNVPATVTSGSSTLSFAFDGEHNRVQQTAPEGTTLYLNGGGVKSEKFTATATGVVTWRNYIVADGQTKAVYNQTENATATKWGSANWNAFNWSSTYSATAILYLHADHLGSIAAITNASGAVVERDSYDPWGKRRNLNGSDDTNDTLAGSQTTHGYTDQEELNDVALLHLNARLYDPQIGKFYGTKVSVTVY